MKRNWFNKHLLDYGTDQDEVSVLKFIKIYLLHFKLAGKEFIFKPPQKVLYGGPAPPEIFRLADDPDAICFTISRRLEYIPL